MKSKIPFTIVPSQPGYFVLEPSWGDGPNSHVVESLTLTPVVAWRIETVSHANNEDYDSYSYPVCVDSYSERGTSVLCPDGSIVFQEDRIFHSIEEALAYVKSYLEKK